MSATGIRLVQGHYIADTEFLVALGFKAGDICTMEVVYMTTVKEARILRNEVEVWRGPVPEDKRPWFRWWWPGGG